MMKNPIDNMPPSKVQIAKIMLFYAFVAMPVIVAYGLFYKVKVSIKKITQ